MFGKRAVNYEIFSAESAAELSDVVVRMLSNGWEISGGAFFGTDTDLPTKWYYQPMVIKR